VPVPCSQRSNLSSWIRSGFRVSGIVFAILALAGCGSTDRPELASVSGRVTLDDQPLAGAMIAFQPEAGQASRGVTDADGRYELIYLRDIRGAVLGHHKVTITTATENAPQERLPARYHAQSELTAEVKEGDNPIDFALRSD